MYIRGLFISSFIKCVRTLVALAVRGSDNRIDKLDDLKRDTMLTPFYGMKYGNIFGRNKK